MVQFDVMFEFRSSLHTTAAKLFFEDVNRQMLAAFLSRAASLQKMKNTTEIH
jgi:ribosome-associated toxin RatA of RatAB toxin-antitoxin module